MVKTSANAPHTGSVIQDILYTTFSEEYIYVIQGGNDEVLEVISRSVDYIFFTGSPGVGRLIMEKAAKNLTPLTLELGGKSPAIIDKTANLKVAAYRLVWAKFLNSGQTCIAPDHVYVHTAVKQPFIDYLIATIKEFYGDAVQNSPDYGRIINEKQFDRLISYLDPEKIVYGGQHDRNHRFIAPTIMDTITYADKVMEAEIFGPILPILPYENLDIVLDEIRSKPKPLALYLFTEDPSLENKIHQCIQFGGGCVNDAISHVSNPHLPFGGVGNSGVGAYHGKASFDAFSHQKSILKKSTRFNIKMLFPPYGNKVERIKKLIR